VTQFANYKAPHEDSSFLCEPPADNWSAKADCHSRLWLTEIRWSGIELNEIRQWTRRDALRYSHCNTNTCSDLNSETDDDLKRWYVSGHQPELFHPGVWFKNFILYAAAQRQNAVSLNVVIDHDSSTPVSIIAPVTLSDGTLGTKHISVSDPTVKASVENVPWELTFENEPSDWYRFQEEVNGLELLPRAPASRESLGPLANRIIPLVVQAIGEGAPLGKAIASARHQIELDSGVRNHEILFSQLAQGRGFSAFVFEILSTLESFRDIYHSSREAYREHHRIKNASQPIPRLSQQFDGEFEWLEAPFWVYRKDDPIRRPLWVRYTTNSLIVSNLNGWESTIDRCGSFEAVNFWWEELLRKQVAIRPRALTTTLFMRLAIADLFLHGIGGGKYDQITDMIIRKWCGIEPPAFAVATATLFLPMKSIATAARSTEHSSETTGAIRERLRDYKFNPERLVSDHFFPRLEELLREHQTLLNSIPTGAMKAQWHLTLQDNKSEIRMALNVTEHEVSEQLRQSIEVDRQKKIRASREYSMALFPDVLTQQKLIELASANFASTEKPFVQQSREKLKLM